MSIDGETASLLHSPCFSSTAQKHPEKLQCKYGHETYSNCGLGFVCLVWDVFLFVCLFLEENQYWWGKIQGGIKLHGY